MFKECNRLIDKLNSNHILSCEEYLYLIKNKKLCFDYLFSKSSDMRDKIYGKDIYIRGLIEFTNYCKNNCLYCGIRRDNKNIERYRLSKEEILDCADYGYDLGFKTFVMQGGEDSYYTDDMLSSIISSIKNKYPDVAITLSIGERRSLFKSPIFLRSSVFDSLILLNDK